MGSKADCLAGSSTIVGQPQVCIRMRIAILCLKMDKNTLVNNRSM